MESMIFDSCTSFRAFKVLALVDTILNNRIYSAIIDGYT